jgi:hypothetical protein
LQWIFELRHNNKWALKVKDPNMPNPYIGIQDSPNPVEGASLGAIFDIGDGDNTAIWDIQPVANTSPLAYRPVLRIWFAYGTLWLM